MASEICNSKEKSESNHRLTCFHRNHGANVILYDNNTVAYRKASFADAVTFSERPLLPGEIFLVEIEKIEPGWTGHMRLGLTQIDPDEPKSLDLPPYSLPDLINLGNSWICAITKSHNRVQEEYTADQENQDHYAANVGSIPQGEGELISNLPGGVQHNHQAEDSGLFNDLVQGDMLNTSRGLIPRSVLLPPPHSVTNSNGKKIIFIREILPTDEGSRIGVVYIPKGDLAEMHYIINGEDQGAFTRRLPFKDGPLYAVVDVYGTTKQVRIIQLTGGVAPLKKICRTTILRHIAMIGIKSLPLPRTLKDYLLYET